jgi:predicted TIM-barrel fold metal-dependent hydrolase
VATPLADFTGLARAFPQTKFILAHWGGLLPLVDATTTAAALPNVWYDTAASPLLYDPDIWGRALPVYGADRVVFGSDFPLNLYPQQDESPGLTRLVAEVRAARVPEAVLSANFLGLLSPTAVPDGNEGP